jgi:hypothetical protein
MALTDFLPNLTSTFVFQNFIPFIVLFAIFLGLLEAINRFKAKTNLVISLGFALIAAFTNPWVLSYIATLGSYAALIIFGMLFLFGIIRWGLGRGKDIYYETASKGKQLDKLTKQAEKLLNEYKSAPEGSKKKEEIHKRLRDIETQIDMARRDMK